MFADNTIIDWASSDNEDVLVLQQVLYKMNDWSTTLKFPFRPDRGKVVQGGNRKLEPREYRAYESRKKAISKVNNEAELGVNFDSEHTFEKHIAHGQQNLGTDNTNFCSCRHHIVQIPLQCTVRI